MSDMVRGWLSPLDILWWVWRTDRTRRAEPIRVRRSNAVPGASAGEPGREQKLLEAIETGTLGQGSVAEGEYLRNMKDARLCADGTTRCVEVCYCPTPLQEERPYWEEHFELTRVQDAQTIGGGVAINTAPSSGPAATATALRDWNKSWR
jgi:hypothetical protein